LRASASASRAFSVVVGGSVRGRERKQETEWEGKGKKRRGRVMSMRREKMMIWDFSWLRLLDCAREHLVRGKFEAFLGMYCSPSWGN
jgi:hypothetical protein